MGALTSSPPVDVRGLTADNARLRAENVRLINEVADLKRQLSAVARATGVVSMPMQVRDADRTHTRGR